MRRMGDLGGEGILQVWRMWDARKGKNSYSDKS